MRPTIADLRDALAARDIDLRRSAAIVLGASHAGDRSAMRLLIDALADREAVVRLAAAQSLCKLGAATIPLLVRALAQKGDEHRIAILQTIRLMGPSARRARPKVQRLTKHELLRPWAESALSAMEQGAEIPWQRWALRMAPLFLVSGVILEVGSVLLMTHGFHERYGRAPLAIGFAILGAYFGAVLGGSMQGWRGAYVSAKAHSALGGAVGFALGILLDMMIAPLLKAIGT